jgi:hypothetical protein
MLPEKGHNAKSGRPDPGHDAADPGGDGAAPGRDNLDPRGESAAPIRGALDPLREDNDPEGGVSDPIHAGSDPIRAILDPRGVNLTDRGGIVDPRVGSVTNVNASPAASSRSATDTCRTSIKNIRRPSLEDRRGKSLYFSPWPIPRRRKRAGWRG